MHFRCTRQQPVDVGKSSPLSPEPLRTLPVGGPAAYRPGKARRAALFIMLKGISGAGKSTLVALLAERHLRLGRASAIAPSSPSRDRLLYLYLYYLYLRCHAGRSRPERPGSAGGRPATTLIIATVAVR
jgi:hypothetical protein